MAEKTIAFAIHSVDRSTQPTKTRFSFLISMSHLPWVVGDGDRTRSRLRDRGLMLHAAPRPVILSFGGDKQYQGY